MPLSLQHAAMAYKWFAFAISPMCFRFTGDRVDGCLRSESVYEVVMMLLMFYACCDKLCMRHEA